MKRRVTDHPEPTGTTQDSRDDELLTIEEVCIFFGGIGRSTLYAGIKRGFFPRPIHLTEKTRRWSKRACEKALETAKQRYRAKR